MKVKVKKSALVDFLKSKINEDISSAEHNTILGIDIEDEGPIEPVEMMATQLAVERPPVDDPEFIPASISELANSASAIAQECPGPQLEWFYRKLHELLDVALDRQDAAERDGSVLHAEEKELRDLKSGDLAESLVRKFLRRKILSEGLNPDQIEMVNRAAARMQSLEDAGDMAQRLADFSEFQDLDEWEISTALEDAFTFGPDASPPTPAEPEIQPSIDQQPEEDEDEDDYDDDEYERQLEEPLTSRSSATPEASALEDAKEFFLANREKYTLDAHELPIGAGVGGSVVPFDVRFAKDSENSEAVVDNIITDLRKTGTFGPELDAVKDKLENYVLSFLKDPERVQPRDVQIGDANAAVDELIKKHEDADDLEEFLKDAQEIADQAREAGDESKSFYIQLIASDYYLTRDLEVDDPAEYFGEEGEELSDEEVSEIRRKFREESRQQALELEFEPGALILSNKALRALMDDIANDMGTGLGNVRNVVYDDLKMMGMDIDQLEKMMGGDLPGGRKSIPPIYDPLLVMAAEDIIEKSYELFRYSLDKYVEDLGPDEADEYREVFARAYQPGIEGYMRLQDMSAGDKIDDPANFRRTRKSFEATQIFLDELAKEMVPDSQKEAKEGGIRAFMLDLKSSNILDADRREGFDEFLAKKIKGFDGFKRDDDFLISAIDTALSKSEKRAAKYIKQLEKEKAGKEKKQMAELSKLIDSVV